MSEQRRKRYRVSDSGSALHVPSCAALFDKADVQGLTVPEARRWLDSGDRRFCCRRCLPADPRLVRGVA